MFDNLKAMKQMMSMMGNPAELKAKAERLQAELADKTVQADAGAGAVRVTVNGKMEVLNIELNPAMLNTLAPEAASNEADRQMVQDLIIAATNEALDRAKQMAAELMSELTGGMNLPGF